MDPDEETVLRMLRRFHADADELASLAVELEPGNRDVEDLRRLVLTALKTSDLLALELAGGRLAPHAERIYERDATLLKTLRAEAAGSDVLLPLIARFEGKWAEMRPKRRERIFGCIEGILKVYMVVHRDVPPDVVGL